MRASMGRDGGVPPGAHAGCGVGSGLAAGRGVIGPARRRAVSRSHGTALRTGNRVDATAGQAKGRTARTHATHGHWMATALRDPVDHPHLERVVEAVPDGAVAPLIAAEAGHESGLTV